MALVYYIVIPTNSYILYQLFVSICIFSMRNQIQSIDYHHDDILRGAIAEHRK